MGVLAVDGFTVSRVQDVKPGNATGVINALVS